MPAVAEFTLAQLADALQLESGGDASVQIRGLAPLSAAAPGQLSFLANSKYRKQLAETAASAVIVHPDEVGQCPVPCLIAENPYLAFARATALFDNAPVQPAGIHPSAVVAESAQLGEGVAVGPNAVVGERVSIGAGSRIGAGTVLGDDVIVGRDCLLHANVSVYYCVTMGDEVTLHSGVVVGADGFGFAPSAEGWVKIHQLGGVRIGSRVEVGANTTIDRGALGDTVIADGVIIDNQVQIAHNVSIGEGTAMAGCSAVAGSATIGRNCLIAGGAGIVGHIEVADGTQVTARAMVTKSITEKGSYSSGTPLMSSSDWRKSAVRFTQLDAMHRRLAEVEKKLAK